MNWMYNVYRFLLTAAEWFHSIGDEISGWVYPFWGLREWFWDLYYLFNKIAVEFYHFSVWLDTLIADIGAFLSWEAIRDYIISWFYWLGDLSTLFLYFWYNVITIVFNWWADISLLVQGWIDEAKALLQDQLNYLTWLWGNLQAAWDAFKGKIPSIDEIIAWFANWWGNVLATVINWGALTATQIGSLIDSVIRTYAPFWEGWLDWRDSVIEFIQDPWQWLYDRAEELFDRFW